MIETLKTLKDMRSDNCVTLIFNTHRTSPDNKRDPILLKTLIKQAEERLANELPKSATKKLVDKLEKLAREVDHSKNLESMVVCVNETICELIRLPVRVEDRVVIDSTFATRDLVRAMHQQQAYYVLVLSRQAARLIKANTDQVDQELTGVWPMDYGKLYTTNKVELTQAKGKDNFIEEFFNRVDKAFQEEWKTTPLPLVLVSEKRNHDHFIKVTDNDRIIVKMDRNRDKEKAHHIVADTWPEVKTFLKEQQQKRISELQAAVGTGKYLSDFTDIWQAVREGRGQTVFVERGLFQPAQVEGDNIILLDDQPAKNQGYIDDLIDEIIEFNLQHGGDTVFVEKGQLEEFEGCALITRY